MKRLSASPSGFLAIDIQDSVKLLTKSLPFVALNVVFLAALNIALEWQTTVSIFYLAPLAIADAGVAGMQRVWYWSRMVGPTLSDRDMFQCVFRMIPRFSLLGIVILGPLAVLLLALGASMGCTKQSSTVCHVGVAGRALPLLVVLALDVVLTFVVPILALTTSSIVGALREGVSMLKPEWSSARWHILAPGMTLAMLGTLVPSAAVARLGPLLVGLAGGLVALVLKGAIMCAFARGRLRAGEG